ncbi:MAG: hypothetical protein CVV47_12190 [Spirochaetae bacterium HGW-Spirochaetae-3]|jgi:PAS domain S-box-containing protein|nr:MAG: hypothetical protein CVV47_12190 [Spirochaetae bacterium HGW-Spirochaetae-3]
MIPEGNDRIGSVVGPLPNEKFGLKTLLLVEDEMIIAMGQKLFLEKYGYKVITINTGEKAVEIMKDQSEIELALVPESKKDPLEKIGYHVILASNAEQAVEIVKGNDLIDLVLMDIDLGTGMDGTQAAELILKHRDIPILFLSSHTEPDIVERTQKISSYGYVVKNSSITVLDASIKMAFKLFEANRKLKEELTERKALDEKIRDSESRYRRLFETTQEGILILDAETGMIVDVNPFLISLLGYSYQLFMGKAIWDIGFLKDIVGNREKFAELQKNSYVRYENLPLETITGKIIEVEFISNVYEVSGARVIQCNIRDITERKEYESGLEATRKELEAIKRAADEASEFAENVIDTVREPLLSLDQDLRVVTVSRSFYDFFKVLPSETVGRLIYDLGNKQWDIPGLRELLENILPRQVSFDDYEVEHDFATIGRRTMLLNARQIIQESGKPRIILLAIEDVTERKLAETTIQALLAEKELVLKEVHHRIKNSMNTIKSLLGLQAEMLEDPTAKAALEDSQNRVTSMMLLYDKLYRSVDYSEISMKEYVSSLIDEIIATFPNGDLVRIKKDLEDFTLDGKRLQSIGIIVTELLTNSMKYAFPAKDGGTISVSTSARDGSVTMIIRDDGRGIPDPMTLENSTGFGLILVRTLVSQLKGTVRIERDGGTAFILQFKR